MDARFSFAEAIGIITTDFEGGAFDASFFAHGLVNQIAFEAFGFGPAGVGAQQHFGPIGGIGAPHARFNRQKGIAVVVASTEEHFDFEFVDISEQACVFAGDFVVEGIIGEAKEFSQGVEAGVDVVPAGYFSFETSQALHDLLGGAGIIPQIRVSGLVFEGRNRLLACIPVKAAHGRSQSAPVGIPILLM